MTLEFEPCCLCGGLSNGIYVRMHDADCRQPVNHGPLPSWTHAVCEGCYDKHYPGRAPVRVIDHIMEAARLRENAEGTSPPEP